MSYILRENWFYKDEKACYIDVIEFEKAHNLIQNNDLWLAYLDTREKGYKLITIDNNNQIWVRNDFYKFLVAYKVKLYFEKVNGDRVLLLEISEKDLLYFRLKFS